MTTSFTGGPITEPALPDYAPIPKTALGPAVNDHGYYVDLGVGIQVHP